MATSTERNLLNGLIETCHDAERGFRDAATLVADDTLRTMFLKLASESTRFALELEPHARRLGGCDAGDGMAAAAWHRRWMQMRNRVTSPGDADVVAEVGRAADVSLSVYDDAVKGLLPPVARELVERQHSVLRYEHALLVALSGSIAGQKMAVLTQSARSAR